MSGKVEALNLELSTSASLTPGGWNGNRANVSFAFAEGSVRVGSVNGKAGVSCSSANGCGPSGGVKVSAEGFSVSSDLNIGFSATVGPVGGSVKVHAGEAATAVIGAALDFLEVAGKVWKSATGGTVARTGDKQ